MGHVDIKFLVILGIQLGLKQANAVNCYECTSINIKCNDPFETAGASTLECKGSCYKIHDKISKGIERGCQPITTTGETCVEATIKQISGKMCSCKVDLCNYALPVGSSIIVTAEAMIIYIVLR